MSLRDKDAPFPKGIRVKPTLHFCPRGRGFTLLELLFAIAVGAIVTGAVLAFSLYSSRTLAGLGNYLDLEQQSRRTLDVLSRDVRGARSVTAITPNRLTLRSATGATITYDYSPTNRTLDRLEGSWRTVLSECDRLTFALQKPRQAIPVLYHDFAAAPGTNGQVLSVTCSCARGLPASKVNTEAGQSAKIVIRNAP